MLGFLFFDDENKSVECVYFNGLAEKVFKLINVNRYGVGVVSLLCDGRRLYFLESTSMKEFNGHVSPQGPSIDFWQHAGQSFQDLLHV